MAFTMTPVLAFAEPADETITQEPATESVVQEETAETGNTAETHAGEADEVGQLQEEAKLLGAKALKGGRFEDEGSVYRMEDVSGYDSSMNIYAFYLGRGKDGDAVLIESDGRYLLMDTGSVESAARLIDCLQDVMGTETKLDVYLSHMHGDHTGGLESVLLNYDVGRVFFPDIELCENYKTPNTGKSIDRIYAEHTSIAVKKGAQVVYLRPDASVRASAPRAANTYSKFNVGGAVCSVVGPLGTYRPDDFISYVKELKGRCGTKEGHCLNNSSLCTIISCGNKKYISAGDIEKHEESKLVKRYGKGLNCDIMKLTHHGLRTSCTASYAAKVTPMWSFQQNHGYRGTSQSAIDTAKKYGYNFGVADNERAVIFTIKNNTVRVFRDYNNNNLADDGLLKGWASCGGGTQYYDGAGYIRTGWSWIGGYAYYMSGSSGFRYTGSHRINGTKVKFSSSGRLSSHKKPAKVSMRSAKAKIGGKITIKWRKAPRAGRYQVYGATSRNGSYTYLGTFSKRKRSFTSSGLKPGQRYYYKVRAIRYVAGGAMYGAFSDISSAKAK